MKIILEILRKIKKTFGYYRKVHYFCNPISARMAELVDAQDLKSCEQYVREGSSPSPSTKERLSHDNDTASYFFIEKMNFKQFLFSDKNWC